MIPSSAAHHPAGVPAGDSPDKQRINGIDLVAAHSLQFPNYSIKSRIFRRIAGHSTVKSRYTGTGALAFGRTYATATTGMDRKDITQRVIDDHQLVRNAYRQMQMSTGEEAQKWFNEMLKLIAVHSVAEEVVVYDVLDKIGQNNLADKSRADHMQVKIACKELDGEMLTTAIRARVDAMFADLESHMQMEEGPGGDLDVLRRGVSQDELESLGRSYARTKHFVPTHAHPSAPDKPPFETIAGLMTAPLDKLRDLFRSFPEDAPKSGSAA